MMRSVALLTFLLSLLLNSCTTFHANQAQVSNQIDTWLQEHKYDKALKTIQAIPEDHPDYQVLRDSSKQIEQHRRRYIQQTLNRAAQFEPGLDWVTAESVIDAALKNLPNAPELQARKKDYQEKRQTRIDKDEAAILLAKAKYLMTSRPFQESARYNANADHAAKQRYKQYIEDCNQVSQALYALGYNYWQEEKYTQAKQTLRLSIRISANEMSNALLNDIQKAEQQQRNQQRQLQSQQAQKQLPELEKSFSQRLDKKDFSGAQQVLNEIKAMGFTDLNVYQQRLLEHKTKHVEQLIHSGDTLYNSGYISEAIGHWQQALELAPENTDIQQNIEHAETFLRNMERWQSQPGQK